MKNIVKLYIYNIEPERVIVDVQEAEDFGDFILVTVDPVNLSQQDGDRLLSEFASVFPDKKVLMIDKSLDLNFYGVKEFTELELPSAD
jgi:hypothetical protein